ncbi:hypothetical protein [Nocardia brasiliensis]|uniref:hypothetical protein n=1 Tax=Nocardia brasiliensis TaxID=37326 RepID=UPI003D7A26F3
MNGDPDLLIDGRWTHAEDGGVRQIIDPADGSVVATVDEATPRDAQVAVAAAPRPRRPRGGGPPAGGGGGGRRGGGGG